MMIIAGTLHISISSTLIKPLRACARITVVILCVCVSVCLSVCYRAGGYIPGLYVQSEVAYGFL